MSLRRMILIALFTALMFVLTYTVVIPIPPFGFINLSDMLIMLTAPYFGVFGMLFVAGLGTAFADIALTYVNYSIFTFVIKSLEATIIYLLIKKLNPKYRLGVYTLGAIIMLCGYGLADVILSANFAMFIPSVLANLPQAIACTLLATLVYRSFDKLLGRKFDESK